MKKFKQHIVLVLLLLFGYPTVYQAIHTFEYHTGGSCDHFCAGKTDDIDDYSTLIWKTEHSKQKSCLVIGFKLALKDIPVNLVSFREIDGSDFHYFVNPESVPFTDIQHFISPRAPPVSLL
ncbi:MAG: hypothetical protein FD155_2150 [Bacteroidetes bacterium]|nr:MAG: hypothetical protein FD155_2150 [Bacteroidota bacterium]